MLFKCLFSSLRSLRAQRSNLDVAFDEKRDCRALWARNDDDNFRTLKRHLFNKMYLTRISSSTLGDRKEVRGRGLIRAAMFFNIVLLLSAPAVTANAKIRVVAATADIGAIVTEIGRENVDVTTLLPGKMCPGHCDVNPGMMKKIEQADIVISHEWENWIRGALASTRNKSVHKVPAKTAGNWMIPQINIKAAWEIAGILASVDKVNTVRYRENLGKYIVSINYASSDISRRFRKYAGRNIISSERQKPFIEWLGLNVVSVYGAGGEPDAREIAAAISAGRNTKVALVVDNLQSGPKAGKSIADELKARRIVLTNFPDDNSYVETLRKNAELVERALK